MLEGLVLAGEFCVDGLVLRVEDLVLDVGLVARMAWVAGVLDVFGVLGVFREFRAFGVLGVLGEFRELGVFGMLGGIRSARLRLGLRPGLAGRGPQPVDLGGS